MSGKDYVGQSTYIVFDEAALAQVFDSTQGPVAKTLQKTAIRVVNAAKRLCPVDTGRLRSSITSEIGKDSNGLVARIGTDVEYAPYVEFGTKRMHAQPFLRPAADDIRGVRIVVEDS